MKKFKIFLITLLSFICLDVSAIEYDGIYENNDVVYSPNLSLWSQKTLEKCDVVFRKNVSDTNSHYVSSSLNVYLNSNFEFIVDGRLIGVDNNNLKYYEIVYKNNVLVENELSYTQLQDVFSGIDVIKISDFKKGVYTIINHSENKEILLYNDTNESFYNYFVYPELYVVSEDIKGLLKIPRRGKLIISDVDDKTKKEYVIRVR